MTPTQRALAVIDEALSTHRARQVFALFSGGHDSLVATHIAAQHPNFVSAVHINTGIGIEKTRQFVRQTCCNRQWPLREYHASKLSPLSYRDMVLKWGFPGPSFHRIMYNRLKERGLEQLSRDTKKSKREQLVLISGCRSQESTRRMGHVDPIQFDRGRVWCAPIHDWSKDDVNQYLSKRSIPRNPVVDLIHKSGECLCGAFAKKGELAELEMWFPEAAAEIRQLEADVRAAGFCWGWEERPPKWALDDPNQGYMFDMASLHPLCWSCERQETQG